MCSKKSHKTASVSHLLQFKTLLQQMRYISSKYFFEDHEKHFSSQLSGSAAREQCPRNCKHFFPKLYTCVYDKVNEAIKIA